MGIKDRGEQIDKTESSSQSTQWFKTYLYCIKHTCQADDMLPQQIIMMSNKNGDLSHLRLNTKLKCV